jgi:hypothetical protein
MLVIGDAMAKILASAGKPPVKVPTIRPRGAGRDMYIYMAFIKWNLYKEHPVIARQYRRVRLCRIAASIAWVALGIWLIVATSLR